MLNELANVQKFIFHS